jgi:hypothetical protein
MVPNPVTDGFRYVGTASAYRLFDILGRTVAAGQLQQGRWLPLENAPPGSYFLRVEKPSPGRTIRILKIQ